ncbi:hypothetical protein CF327_g2433, partial [Tilletia walkeri]
GFRRCSAVKTPDKLIEATRTQHIHRSHAHRIPPATHPPINDPLHAVALEIPARSRRSEGRDRPHATIATTHSAGCPGLQAKLPTKFTFPRMHKPPIAHTQSIVHSYIHPHTCNTTYKVDTGPYARQYGNNATARNPDNAATAPRQQSIVLMLVCSPFVKARLLLFSSPSQTTSIGHPLHIHTKWTHTLRSRNRNEDAQVSVPLALVAQPR